MSAPIELKTGDLVAVTPEQFKDILIAGKKKAKKPSTAKKPSPAKKGRKKSVSDSSTDYCFNCKSLTPNKNSEFNAPYRCSNCGVCGNAKKAFVNP